MAWLDNRTVLPAVLAAVGALGLSAPDQQPAAAVPVRPGVMIEHLVWPDAETRLTADAIVVLPLGAGAVQHGPHLMLGNDLTVVRYLVSRLVDVLPVVVAPVLTYHANPDFVEYPGSASLALETAASATTEIVRSLARFGPRRFYALNAGHAAIHALESSAEQLAAEGILLRFTRIEDALEPAASTVRRQEGGAHADEIETSMMLYIDPRGVDMSRAVRDYTPWRGRLTRQAGVAGTTHSPSGTWGDPTLATRAKGQLLVEHLVTSIAGEINALRSAPLPVPRGTTVQSQRALPARGPVGAPATGCTEGDERAIRRLGDAFTVHWSNGDAASLGALWSPGGDIFHPDGTIERTRIAITANRFDLFRRREYRSSKHPLSLTIIRCVDTDVAVADGKWELRGVIDAAGRDLPTFEGQVTMVVKRVRGAGWEIEAYRYTIAAQTAKPPALLKQPGWQAR